MMEQEASKKGFELLDEIDINHSPTSELRLASGRAKCRICGNKIEKGVIEIEFFASFTDGGSYNPWTAVTCHAHRTCAPSARVEYKNKME